MVERTSPAMVQPPGSLQRLREGAIEATDVCFVITDPRQPDNPVVWVNPAFTRVTGYAPEEIVGRNCRMLQVADTDPVAVAHLAAAVAAGLPATTTVLNRRRDGSEFWNELTVSPVFEAGELVSYIGVQSDVSERVRADQERVRALSAERVTRRHAELARDRLRLMAEGTSQLGATLDTAELLQRLVGLCVPALATWGYAVGIDESAVVAAVRAAHTDGRIGELDRLRGSLLGWPLPAGSIGAASVATGAHRLDPAGGPVVFRTAAEVALAAVLGAHTVLTVPLVARGHTLGVLTLVSADGPPAADDVDAAVDLGRRAAMAMDNARLYQQEFSTAETLQRALLPTLPQLAGVTVHAHYRSASSTAAVGGDFYDVVDLSDGCVGFAIGDVAGHDIDAAAQMGELRGLLRACVYDAPDPDPAAVLDRLDRLVLGLGLGTLATLVYARAEPVDGGGWRLHVATAGHPPLVLCGPGGDVRELDEVHGLMLGVTTGRVRSSTVVDVLPGTTVLAYTDGLVEHRGADLDEGTAELLGLLGSLGPQPDPAAITRAAMTMADNRLDDVACLSLTLH